MTRERIFRNYIKFSFFFHYHHYKFSNQYFHEYTIINFKISIQVLHAFYITKILLTRFAITSQTIMKFQIAFIKFDDFFIQSNINDLKSLFVIKDYNDFNNKTISFFDQVEILIFVTRSLNKLIEKQIFENLYLNENFEKNRDEIRKKYC